MSSSNDVVKKTKGRQKVEMKKMSNERNLQATFSKRRSGIFKKASELCTLCNVDIAVVVFSPAHKAYSFGSPNVDAVIQRYLTWAPPPPQTLQNMIEAHRSSNARDLNAQLARLANQLEAEKNRGEELSDSLKASQAQWWWASPIEDMNRAQLEWLKGSLEELKKHVTHKAQTLLIQSANFNNNNSINHLFSGNSFLDVNNNLHPPSLLQNNYVFDGNMMHHHHFNNIGGYGPYAADAGFNGSTQNMPSLDDTLFM
ncbi:agamous-like MADS-box protein AGL62 [Abrus precatorius]|uniref:Agamous-like MADS-box protein AGL62 n=1 Tax=Abrus precatorius TaxID=3816 RepID=A0A8B8MB13_ABRPR|nr:agamous-like MADS-box protein AGL62 [Abrus precatorius]